VLAAGSPDSVGVPCPSWPLKTIKSAGGGTSAGLGYSSTTGNYTYGWQTDAGWAGTCRQFRLATNDGTAAHSAVFEFTS
jgi:hypothetical protein